MKNQVLSVEQMLKLQRLGIDISSSGMCWCRPTGYKNEKWELEIHEDVIRQERDPRFWEIIQTFTLQDIIKLLPRSIQPNPNVGTFYLNLYYHDLSYVVDYLNNEGDGSYVAKTSDDSFIKAAYPMLLWCIENGYIEKKKDKVFTNKPV